MCRERSATIPPLRDSQTLLKDENRDVRLCAAEALGKLRAVTTVPALIQALQDPEKEVRECASGWKRSERARRKLRYSIQGFNCDDPERKDLLFDIGTEELSHLEIVATGGDECDC
jgi:hypothetical protein